MHKADLKELDTRLRQIADALGARAVGAAGLLVWMDVLEGERFDDVLFILTDWCKKNNRMPMPADVAKACHERTSRRIEAQAEENRRNAIGLEDALALASRSSTSNPEIAKRELAKIKAILGDRKGGLIAGSFRHIGGLGPNDDHKEWAKILQVRHESGEHLSMTQIQNYREALGIKVE